MLTTLLAPVTSVAHASVRFEAGGLVVYVDPYKQKDEPHDADLVVITHAHGDHYAPAALRKVVADETVFLTGPDVAALLEKDLGVAGARITVMEAGAEYEGPGGITVAAVPAENKNHPAGSGFGVVLGLAGHRYYLSGDTDTLDKGVACDVLFCVCDGNFNMPDFLQRAPAEILAMETRPRLVVPYHFDNAKQPGNGQRLAERLNALGIEAEVLE